MAGTKDRKEAAAKRAVVDEEERLRRAKNLAAIRRCLHSPDGQVLLRWLMVQCAWNDTSLVRNTQTGEINVQASLYNEARRGVYLDLREFLTPEILMNVEFPKMDDSNQGG